MILVFLFHPISLFPYNFPVIYFDLPITQTFFYLPRRFELSGVDRIYQLKWNLSVSMLSV